MDRRSFIRGMGIAAVVAVPPAMHVAIHEAPVPGKLDTLRELVDRSIKTGTQADYVAAWEHAVKLYKQDAALFYELLPLLKKVAKHRVKGQVIPDSASVFFDEVFSAGGKVRPSVEAMKGAS